MKFIQNVLYSIWYSALVFVVACTPTADLAKKTSNAEDTGEVGTEDPETHVIRTAESIDMEDATTFYNMMRASNKKNRPVFVYFYAEWCVTCPWIEKDIIAAPNVNSFLESNFVSFRVNGEHGNGVDIASDLDIREYPTMVYITTEGNELLRYMGMPNEHKIIQLGKKVLKEERDIKKRKARKKKRKK